MASWPSPRDRIPCNASNRQSRPAAGGAHGGSGPAPVKWLRALLERMAPRTDYVNAAPESLVSSEEASMKEWLKALGAAALKGAVPATAAVATAFASDGFAMGEIKIMAAVFVAGALSGMAVL